MAGAMGWRRLAVILILGYAAFLRLYLLTTTPPGLYRDEAMNGNNALEALETHRWAVFYPENNGREGLYADVASAVIAWWGDEAWAVRLPAAIFGILTVGGVYLLGSACFGAGTGLAAAFFLATSFWHVNFSRLGFRAIAAPCLLVWAAWLLTAGMRRSKWWLVAAAGAVYGLGFYTYIAYRATPLVAWFLLRRASTRMRWLFAIPAGVVAAPLAVYFARHPGDFWERAGGISVLRNAHPAWEVALNVWRTGRMFFTRGDLNWRHNIAWRGELYWPVAALFAVGVLVSAVRLWNGRGAAFVGAMPASWRGFALRSRMPAWTPAWQAESLLHGGPCSGGPKADGSKLRFLPAYGLPLVWLAVAALPVVFSDDVLPHALRSLLMTPAVFLLAAVGARELYGWLAARSGQRAARAAAAALLVWLAWEPYHSYFEVWARNANVPPAFDAAAMDLARRIRGTPGEKIVYVPASDAMAAAPVMFLTGSYTARGQRERQIRYVPTAACPAGARFCVEDGAARYHN